MVIKLTKLESYAAALLFIAIAASAVLYTYSVDRDLSFLKSTIVGSCPKGVDVPDDARCKQGFHRKHGEQLRDEILHAVNTICVDNSLECWQLKRDD